MARSGDLSLPVEEINSFQASDSQDSSFFANKQFSSNVVALQTDGGVENVDNVADVASTRGAPADKVEAVELDEDDMVEPHVTTTDIAVEDAEIDADMVDPQGVVTEMEAIETVFDTSTQVNMVQIQVNDADTNRDAQNQLQIDGHG
ncbi:hypothetical protein V6N11_021779 [Hibiscus sabdariffa]|uniref:Uncharacterized protein n=1 Tax=Hibiscus sabdariffa TaxID=183260 RepID=A0ABR2THI3_9ROSI